MTKFIRTYRIPLAFILFLLGANVRALCEKDNTVDSIKVIDYASSDSNQSYNTHSYISDSEVNLGPNVVRYDSTDIDSRLNGQATIEKLRKDKDFDYSDTNSKKTQYYGQSRVGQPKTKKSKPKEGATPKENTEDPDNSPGFFSSLFFALFEYGQYILMIVAVIAILYFIFKADIKALFKRTPRNYALSIADLTEEDLLNTNLAQSILEAENKKDYRGAIRLYYLQTLKELDNLGLIKWQKDKTNRDYQNELYGTNKYENFGSITLLFNMVWYGHQELNTESYQKLKGPFQDFVQQFKARA